MTAIAYYKLKCNGKRSEEPCLEYLRVGADTVTAARRYAEADHQWISVQDGNQVADFCAVCAQPMLDSGLYVPLSVGRSTHRLKKNVHGSRWGS